MLAFAMRFQRKPLKLLTAYCLAVFAIVAPCLAIIYTAKFIGMRQQQERAESIAAELLRRSHRVSEQMRGAIGELGTSPDGEACSERHLDLMRQSVVKSNMFIDVGLARGDQLLCSSFGRKPLNIGAPTYVSKFGFVVRINVPHPLLPDARILMITDAKTGVTVEIHSDSVLELTPSDSALSVGIVGWTDGRVLVQRGHFDPAWLQWMGDSLEASRQDGQSMVALKRSPNYSYAAFVAIPASEMLLNWERIAWVLSPLGIVSCLAFLLILRQYARQQASMPVAIRQALVGNDFFLVWGNLGLRANCRAFNEG